MASIGVSEISAKVLSFHPEFQNYLHEPKYAMVIIKPNQSDMILTCLEKLEMVPSAFDFVNGAEVEACDLDRETHF